MSRRKNLKAMLAGGSCALALATAGMAAAQTRDYDVPAGDLMAALDAYARQSGVQIIYRITDVSGVRSGGAQGALSADEALNQLLAGTNFEVRRDPSGAIALAQAGEGGSGPQSGSAAAGGAEVEALIVTAQKREEDIQDVPIAISAFTQETLERSQIAGGPDLMTQVPNMTFTKTNFSSYSIQIRGIGTQAISATTDPAVAVAFNNTPFIRNRFFEQEFYDLARVEVLRGPQGTLYGRNATAGVVNIISQRPKFAYEAKLSGDIANYNTTRLEGMVNIPLAEDVVALRIAGAWTKREGYSTNAITGNPIDGRDLWSTRVSLRFAPTDALNANLVWEHFEEDDDRLRSGKQLCHRDAKTEQGGLSYTYGIYDSSAAGGRVSQGCLPASLYSPESFEAPNGFALPYYHPLATLGVPVVRDGPPPFDPYASTTQSRDLRVIESTVDPQYRAQTDILELQIDYEIGSGLTLASETAYGVDDLFSTQDYNRFNTRPGAFDQERWDTNIFNDREGILEDGVFCDPQIGCADRVVAVDLSTSQSRQFSQEFRLNSDYSGPFNFSVGANYLRADSMDKYYVFVNTLTLFASMAGRIPASGFHSPMPAYVGGVSDNRECLARGMAPLDPTELQQLAGCIYIDPNPIGSLDDMGRNYFLSKNPYKLISYAVFGEAYYNFTDALKLTAGLRWTVDKKEAPRIPSYLLGANTVGLPVAEVIEQEWREPTGRLTLDWKPALGFTDETLLYASYARGYKAGGSNPPAAGIVMWTDSGGAATGLLEQSATAPRTFDPEFVHAFELGTKNTLLAGRLTLNANTFYYDYTDYQISYIVNRSAVNLNFDAEVWGLELEADWRPLENLRLGFKGGYQNTRVADGESAIDVMDRANGGRPDENGVSWIVVRPFPTFPSNCIVPLYTVAGRNDQLDFGPNANTGGNVGYCERAYVLGNDPVTNLDYVANPTVAQDGHNVQFFHPGYIGFDPATAPNNGEGFSKDLSGNKLPNAPNYTATITADYTVPLPSDWLMTLHTDLYYQSEAWTRIFNTEGYDKLKAYTNVNLAAIFTNEEAGWKVMAYVKNVMDRDSITGAFLNSDDSGLTTNVFLTEPRLYGVRVTKEFTGGPWWTGADPSSNGPFPLTVELGGQVQRHDAPYENLAPEALDDVVNWPATMADTQNRDLDWGDGRSVRLTYQPDGSAWNVSAGVRFGKTNSDTARTRFAEETRYNVCGIPAWHPFQSFLCSSASPYYDAYYANYYAPTRTDATARNSEEHTIVDFAVGRDAGLGLGLSRSEVGVGIRYAEFQSTSTLTAEAVGDWNIPVGWGLEGLGYTRYHADLTADREFSGTGPVLSWDAAFRLLGDNESGHLDVDWSVTAGVLFGEQQAFIAGEQRISEHFGMLDQWPFVVVGTPVTPTPPPPRSQSANVPLLDLSLGLSYEVGRVKVGAGYRWERYFDVLDIGYDEAKEADRTIDGPYFKIAVGFGG